MSECLDIIEYGDNEALDNFVAEHRPDMVGRWDNEATWQEALDHFLETDNDDVAKIRVDGGYIVIKPLDIEVKDYNSNLVAYWTDRNGDGQSLQITWDEICPDPEIDDFDDADDFINDYISYRDCDDEQIIVLKRALQCWNLKIGDYLNSQREE